MLGLWKGHQKLGPSKSQSEVKFYLDLFSKLFADLTERYPDSAKDFRRDLATLESRVAAEGLSFLTKTLPKLGKAIDASFGSGRLEVPREFKKSHGNSAIPAFLQGMLRRLFCASGCLLVDCTPDIVQDIRQVLFLAYKVEFPYSSKQESQVIDRFCATEVELSSAVVDRSSPLIEDARKLIATALKGFNPREGKPRHGPGAVATGEQLEEKWVFRRLYNSIHQRFPYYDYYVVGGANELLDRLSWYKGLQRLPSGTAKVCLVPKDSRGPRLISCEPLEYQWIQQMIGRELVRHLESKSITRGRVNFTDQSINQKLAQQSSIDGYYATIDMKDASDRVTLDLVEALFPKELYLDLLACRTTHTQLPSGQVVPLNKFAPMGSALCFPVEALVFWALSVSALRSERRLPLHFSVSQVYVYGDDIIVPARHVEAVMQALESVHLKVNRDKSFTSGPFRESCGMDAFKGVPVTPIKIRTMWKGKPTDGEGYVSYLEYANSFADRGYRHVTSFLLGELSKTYGKIPYAVENSSYPGIRVRSWIKAAILNQENGFKYRLHPQYQTPQIFVKFLRAKETDRKLDGWTRLLRNLTEGSPATSVVAHRHSAQIKRGWRTA